MKNAVIYARYSSDRQTEQSIEGQLTVCHQFAKDNGFTILREYIDRAMTGTNDNRPSFQRMIAESARKEWQYVIVYKGDRFARDRISSAINKKALRDNGVKLVSATEKIPDSPEGIIMESLLEGMAEYYSAELSQKVKRGIAESRKKKQFTGGHLVLGYVLVDKHPTICESEAAIVRDIFARYRAGARASDIVRELADTGKTGKGGKPITMQLIFRMLQNDAYFGDGIYPRIIDEETERSIRAIRERNKKNYSRRPSTERYLLSGKLFCGDCGSPMTGEYGTSKKGVQHFYYKCSARKRHNTCSFPVVRKHEIEDKVFDICQRVLDEGFIDHVVSLAYDIHKQKIEENVVLINLQEELKTTRKKLDNILEALANGIYSARTQEMLLSLEKRENELQARIAEEIAKGEEQITKEDYKTTLRHLIATEGDESFRADLFEILIRKVVLFRDRICVTFNFAPSPNDNRRTRHYDDDLAEIFDIIERSNASPDSTHSLADHHTRMMSNTSIFVTTAYWGLFTAFNIEKRQG